MIVSDDDIRGNLKVSNIWMFNIEVLLILMFVMFEVY